MNTDPGKTLTIIAGPNGAGKTTFVENTFSEIVAKKRFINADHFARALNPNNVSKVAIEAGKEFLQEIDRLIKGEKSFVTETTLSGKTLLKKVKDAQNNGFHVKLIFLSLSSVLLCDFRVKARVAAGGHNIKLFDIKRRYFRGLMNIEKYRAIVDSFELYNADNISSLILSSSKKDGETIHSPSLLKQFNTTLEQTRCQDGVHEKLD